MLASELLEEVRDNGDLTPDVDDATILRAADAEIRTRLLPLMRTINEDYLVRSLDIVASNGRVAFPPRAVAASVRLVQLLSGTQLLTLPRMDPGIDQGQAANGPPYGFYFDAGSIVLLPRGSSGTLRVHYYARPGKLCDDTDLDFCAVITGVSNVNPGFTGLSGLGSFTPSATLFDIIASGPAHQHKAINTTFVPPEVPTANLIETPIAGDYIVVADRSPFVALPEELGSTLAIRAAAKILFNTGYKDEAKDQYELAEVAQAAAEALLRPRSDGNPKQLSGGLMGQMGRVGWGGWNGG